MASPATGKKEHNPEMGMSEIDCEFQPEIKYSADGSDNESGQG